ncbi:hypothetical protein C8R47DRAFT_1089611 [Mycena vitilis]|nr:hypothetical protein C8R47DRAFT_1089611 [Mycena vitilis]
MWISFVFRLWFSGSLVQCHIMIHMYASPARPLPTPHCTLLSPVCIQPRTSRGLVYCMCCYPTFILPLYSAAIDTCE